MGKASGRRKKYLGVLVNHFNSNAIIESKDWFALSATNIR